MIMNKASRISQRYFFLIIHHLLSFLSSTSTLYPQADRLCATIYQFTTLCLFSTRSRPLYSNVSSAPALRSIYLFSGYMHPLPTLLRNPLRDAPSPTVENQGVQEDGEKTMRVWERGVLDVTNYQYSTLFIVSTHFLEADGVDFVDFGGFCSHVG